MGSDDYERGEPQVEKRRGRLRSPQGWTSRALGGALRQDRDD